MWRPQHISPTLSHSALQSAGEWLWQQNHKSQLVTAAHSHSEKHQSHRENQTPAVKWSYLSPNPVLNRFSWTVSGCYLHAVHRTTERLTWCHNKAAPALMPDCSALSCSEEDETTWGRREAVNPEERWRLCLTHEHRGRKKIIVDREAKTYQSSEKGNEGKKQLLQRENKYQSKPIIVTRKKIRGSRRSEDTADVW